MSLIALASQLIGKSKSNLLDSVSRMLDDTITSKEELGEIQVKLATVKAESDKHDKEIAVELGKQEIELKKIETEAATRDNELKADIITTEIKSDDAFVRRARPSIVYLGIVVGLLEVFGIRYLVIKLAFQGTPEFAQVLESSNATVELLFEAWGIFADNPFFYLGI